MKSMVKEKVKVLIADSEASVRQFIRYTLQDYFSNVEIEVAPNGKNIQKRIESTPYDLIICDWGLPLLSGDELLKWLKKHETLNNVSFIMTSGNGNEKSHRRAMQLGADSFIVKPLLLENLVNGIKDVFTKLEKDRFDRRKFARFRAEGKLVLTCNSRNYHGKLSNISMGGLLSVFDRNGSLPQILDNVNMSIELDNKRSISGLEGVIIRIQVVDMFALMKQIQYGVKFADEMSVEKKKELLELIKSFKS